MARTHNVWREALNHIIIEESTLSIYRLSFFQDRDETDGLETFEELTDIEILQHGAGLGAIALVQAFLKMPTVLQGSTGTRTPLHAACMNGQVEVVKLLLAARAPATCPDRKGVQPIHLAAQSSLEARRMS